jgi:Fe2+ or Zn2+ uptake regulation protein
MDSKEISKRFGEAYHDHGEVLCDECEQVVDISDAESAEAGMEIWNEHVRSEHQ